ncbi:hypothetical protein HK098_007689 [Nowakowskiella sp. JEL0407]|nr:hypothetical protein HK098_007689 [Nowakowskiella sp. JEL0407]
MPKSIFFNAQHSPIGALASFVLGCKGAKGGMGQCIGKPADQNVYIALECPDQPGNFDTLPFMTEIADAAQNFTQAGVDGQPKDHFPRTFPDSAITRDFQLTRDTWKAGDLTFSVISPVKSIPDPEVASAEELKDVLAPIVFVEFTVDNKLNRPRRSFFGMQSFEDTRQAPAIRHLEDDLYKGVGQGRKTAWVALDHLNEVRSASGFSLEQIFKPKNNTEENWKFGLGQCALLVFDTPPATKRTYTIALCWHTAGITTTGIDASFFYNRYFKDIQAVAKFAATEHQRLIKSWSVPDKLDIVAKSDSFSDDRKFQFVHAVHSYFGSTELLEWEDSKKPLWVVNEGEYLMINTCDLMLDHVFFESAFNPWTIRNNLDLFVSRYSYYDKVTKFGETQEYPGGLSFCHDMGMGNAFTPAGTSVYECVKLDDCFSFMTSEELLNWILTASIYVQKSGDKAWVEKNLKVFKECFESLCNRDGPDAALYTGLIGMESTKTNGGCEITTYDSLDPSLAQTRANVYIGGKCWASYVVLSKIFTDFGEKDLAEKAHQQAVRGAKTMTAALDPIQQSLPAIIGVNHPARIIPAVEGLIYPLVAGCPEALNPDGEFKDYLAVMKTHLNTVLAEGICLFPDGGWKLSSTSINSWLSKIYLNQYIARKILGRAPCAADAKADAAHVHWLTGKSKDGYWCWSDQMYDGIATGSLFYPRGVTSILWCYE